VLMSKKKREDEAHEKRRNQIICWFDTNELQHMIPEADDFEIVFGDYMKDGEGDLKSIGLKYLDSVKKHGVNVDAIVDEILFAYKNK
jgi:hypothetical protein